jgi:hypothetical protein
MTVRRLLLIPILYITIWTGSVIANQGTDKPEVVEFILCQAVEEREPVNPTGKFDTGMERVYAFARISNPGEEIEMQFRWTHEGAVYARIAVKVGTSPAWRTYSTVQALEGDWKVELVGENDDVLSSIEFTVTETSG